MYAIAVMSWDNFECTVGELVVVECERKDVPELKRKLKQHSCYWQMDVSGYHSFLLVEDIKKMEKAKKLTLKKFNRLWKKEHKRQISHYQKWEKDWPGWIDKEIRNRHNTTFDFEEVREKMGKLRWNKARCDKCGKTVVSKVKEKDEIKWCECKALGVTGGRDSIGRIMKDGTYCYRELSEYNGSTSMRIKMRSKGCRQILAGADGK